MLLLLIKDGLLEGTHAIGPSTPARLGVGGVLFKPFANIQPGRSPMQLSPSMLDNIHPMHLAYILRRGDSFAIRPTSNFYAAETELTLYQNSTGQRWPNTREGLLSSLAAKVIYDLDVVQ